MKHILLVALFTLVTLAACTPTPTGTPLFYGFTSSVSTPSTVPTLTATVTLVPSSLPASTATPTSLPTQTATPTAKPSETPNPTPTPILIPSFEQEFNIAKIYEWKAPMNFGSETVFRIGGDIKFIDGSSDPVYKLIADYFKFDSYRIKVAEVTAPIDFTQTNRVQSGLGGFNALPPYQLLLPFKLGSNFEIVNKSGATETAGTLFKGDINNLEITYLWGISPDHRAVVWTGDGKSTILYNKGDYIENDYWYIWDIRTDTNGNVTLYTWFPVVTQDAQGNLILKDWIIKKQASTKTFAATQGRPETPVTLGHAGSAYGRGFQGAVFSGQPVLRSANPF